MNFIFKPSLQHITIVKIVTTLLDQNDINSIVQGKYFITRDDAENKSIEKVKAIALPKLLEEKVLGAIKPIYDEIITWKNYHEVFGYVSEFNDFLPVYKIFWTSHGTVDKKKTAEMWVRNEQMDLSTRFRLACMYCLDNDIPTLWNQLPENLKQPFSTEAQVFQLVKPWNASLNELMWHVSESAEYEIKFENAVLDTNKVAVEYFWNKLEPGQRNKDLLLATKCLLEHNNWRYDNDCYLGETLGFLFSQMTDEQQTEMFEICPYEILKILLEWPRQIFFLETINRMWDFLYEDEYRLLLFMVIIDKINAGYTDYDYREIFKECWQRSPIRHKKFVFSNHTGLCLLFRLFEVKDKNCIQWVLKDATTEEKSNLICTRSRIIYKLLMDAEEWDFLELFMQEFISSKDEMANPKKCTSLDFVRY